MQEGKGVHGMREEELDDPFLFPPIQNVTLVEGMVIELNDVLKFNIRHLDEVSDLHRPASPLEAVPDAVVE